MDPGFRFEDDDGTRGKEGAQPAWEIPGVRTALAAEHAERKTTSIDHKITEQLLMRERMAKRRELWEKKENTERAGASDSWNRFKEEDEEPVVGGRKRRRLANGKRAAEAEPHEMDIVTKLGSKKGKHEGPGKDKLEQGKKGQGRKGRDLGGAEEEDREEDEISSDNEDDESGKKQEGKQKGQNKASKGANGVSHSLGVRPDEDDSDEDDSDDDENEETVKEEEAPRARKKGTPHKGVQVRMEELRRGREESNGKKKNFFSAVEGASFSANSFLELNLSRPLLRACEALGYKTPTPIQAACVPLAMAGRDICGSAMTGSGKTAAFALPILERLLYRPRRIAATRVLIMTPTRELAVQVHGMIEKLAQFTDIRTCLVVGGLSNKVQEAALRTQPDIVVATPGRMLDHLNNAVSVGLEELAVLVLDEADRLLAMGFQEEVHHLVRLCPKRRQTLLFSATMTEEVAALVQLSLNNPVRMSADPQTQRPASLAEEVVKVRAAQAGDKEALLLALCKRTFKTRTIIFSGRKMAAHRLRMIFGLAGLRAGELHGDLTQAMRLAALEEFRRGETDFLIATDVAARGLDIAGVETVVSLECPRDITTYVHRVGRTARAGRGGCAVTFVEDKDRTLLKAMAKRAGSQLRSRVVPPSAVARWRTRIEEMESDIQEIMQREKEERALRKAEMEATKAQNMVEHEAEIFAKPKRVWFQTPRQRKEVADAAKAALEAPPPDAPPKAKVVRQAEAAEQRRKDKLKKERERNLPRKKRRQLEARREAVEDEEEARQERQLADAEKTEKVAAQGNGQAKKNKAEKSTKSLVDLAYRKAKASKAAERLRAAGKISKLPVEKGKKKKKKKEKRTIGSELRNAQKNESGEGVILAGSISGPKLAAVSGQGQPLEKKKKEKRPPGVTKKSFKSNSRYKRRK